MAFLVIFNIFFNKKNLVLNKVNSIYKYNSKELLNEFLVYDRTIYFQQIMAVWILDFIIYSARKYILKYMTANK